MAVVPPHRRDIADRGGRGRGDRARPRLRDAAAAACPTRSMPHYRAGSAPRRRTAARPARRPRPDRGRHPRADRARRPRAAGLSPADDPATIRVANPVTADHSELRRSLLPGMLGVLGAQRAPAAPRSRHLRDRRRPRVALTASRVQTECSASCWPATGAPQSGSSPPAPATSTTSRASSKWLAARLHVGRVEYRHDDAARRRRASRPNGRRCSPRSTG